MLKKISLVFILFFGLTAYVKPGLLKKIVRCEILIDPYEIYPGNAVEVTLLTKLKDSSEIISTQSNLSVNFADYILEANGGATIIDQTRTKLVYRINDDAYLKPYVNLKISLRRKKSITYEVKLPILYDVTQTVRFEGTNGYDPRSTTDNGYKKIPLFKNVNLEFIDNEQTLTNNSDPNILGGKGPDLDVYIELIKTEQNQTFLSALIRSETGKEVQKYLRVGVGQLEVFTVGGKGGISKNGGRGGDGGNVTIFITEEAKPHYDQVYIINHGGDGGELWRPQIDGQKEGPFGNDGQVEIVSWQGNQ